MRIVTNPLAQPLSRDELDAKLLAYRQCAAKATGVAQETFELLARLVAEELRRLDEELRGTSSAGRTMAVPGEPADA